MELVMHFSNSFTIFNFSGSRTTKSCLYYRSNSYCCWNMFTFYCPSCTDEWIQSSRVKCPKWCFKISLFSVWIHWWNGKRLHLCCDSPFRRCPHGQVMCCCICFHFWYCFNTIITAGVILTSSGVFLKKFYFSINIYP